MSRIRMLLVAWVLLSSFPWSPATVINAAPVAQTQPDAPVLSEPCYQGGLAPEDSYCLVVAVTKNGQPVENAQVRAHLFDKTDGNKTTSLVTESVIAAAFDVGHTLHARPGHTLELVIGEGTNVYTSYVALHDHRDATHHEKIEIGKPVDESPTLDGVVSTSNDPTPLKEARVRLFRDNETTPISVVLTSGITPTFHFDLRNEPPGRLRLEADSNNRRSIVEFKWTKKHKYIPMALGWACLGWSPRSGAGSMPQSFCLSGRAAYLNTAITEGSVNISIGDRLVATVPITVSDYALDPGFIFDIGPYLSGHPAADLVRVAVSANGYVGSATRTLADLQVTERWGGWMDVPMQGDREYWPGLVGGVPTLVAWGKSPYAATMNSLETLVVGERGDYWWRLPGRTPYVLPSPEVSALLVWPMQDVVGDKLFAGTRSGTLALSQNSGRSWTEVWPKLSVLSGPISALVQVGSTLYIAAGKTLLAATVSETGTDTNRRLAVGRPTSRSLPFAITALTGLNNTLFAGASDGLRSSSDGGANWSDPVRTQNGAAVTALAHTNDANQSLLLVGTATGLFSYRPTDSQWQELPSAQAALAVRSVGVEPGSNHYIVATDKGIYDGYLNNPTLNSLAWALEQGRNPTSRNALSNTPTFTPTLGAPDIYGIVRSDTFTLIYGFGTSGIYTISATLANPLTPSFWHRVAASPDGYPIRALLPTGPLTGKVLTSQSLYTWSGTSFTNPISMPNAIALAGDANRLLVGLGAGSSSSLRISQDGGATWTRYVLGKGHGVTAIQLTPAQIETNTGIAAFIATDGDGVFAWQPNATPQITRLPDLVAAGGQQERVNALGLVQIGATCSILAGTLGAPARIVERPCDVASAWGNSTNLASPRPGFFRQSLVGEVRDFSTPFTLDNGDVIIAIATSEGVYQGLLNGSGFNVSAVFDLPMRPEAIEIAPAIANTTLQPFFTLVGGIQSGILILSSVAPDVVLTIGLPEQVPGDEILTATLTLRNLGLQTASTITSTLWVSDKNLEPTTPLMRTTPLLASGQVVSYTYAFHVKPDVTPYQTVITATTMPIIGEQSGADNHNKTSAHTHITYRHGADPRVQINGNSTVPANSTQCLIAQVTNAGDRTDTVGGVLRVTLPATMTIIDSYPLATISGQTLKWDAAGLVAGKVAEYGFCYKLPVATNPGTEFSLTADYQLTTGADDRELRNNSDTFIVMAQLPNPIVLAITNMSRADSTNDDAKPHAAASDIATLRTQLTNYLRLTPGTELALDNHQACKLDAYYTNWDNAVKAFAKSDNKDRLRNARTALNTRIALVAAIQGCVQAKRTQYPSIRYIYILGSDAIIPFDAIAEPSVLSELGLTTESAEAANIDVSDTLYSLLANDYYPTDRTYGERVSRSVGTPADITNELKTYLNKQGVLTLQTPDIAGVAAGLTENLQTITCEKYWSWGKSIDCRAISESIWKSFGSWATSATDAHLGIYTGHADISGINTLTSTALANLTLNTTNLFLLTGCHSGLDAKLAAIEGSTYPVAAALIRELAKQAQPAFAYLTYAVADYSDASSAESLIYSEQIALNLNTALHQGGMLADVLADARANYVVGSEPIDPISKKMLDAITLFGPPTWSVQGSITELAAVTEHHKPPLPATGTLTFTYTPQTDNYGTYFTATSVLTTVATRLMRQAGLTIEPGAQLNVPANVRGVRLTGGTFHDFANDPVVMRPGILGSPPANYTEPPYLGGERDWATPITTYTSSDGSRRALFALGQWERHGTQRLFDRIDYAQTTATDPNGKPPLLGNVKATPSEGKVTVTMSKGTTIAADVVLFTTDGRIVVYAMKLQDKNWVAKLPITNGAQYIIQAIGTDGSVLFDTHNSLYYMLPTKAGSAKAPNVDVSPISGNWNFPQAFRVTNTDKVPTEIVWSLGCMDLANAGVGEILGECHTSSGYIRLLPGESFTRGQGEICAKWKFDLRWVNAKPTKTTIFQIPEHAAISSVNLALDTTQGFVAEMPLVCQMP